MPKSPPNRKDITSSLPLNKDFVGFYLKFDPKYVSVWWIWVIFDKNNLFFLKMAFKTTPKCFSCFTRSRLKKNSFFPLPPHTCVHFFSHMCTTMYLSGFLGLSHNQHAFYQQLRRTLILVVFCWCKLFNSSHWCVISLATASKWDKIRFILLRGTAPQTKIEHKHPEANCLRNSKMALRFLSITQSGGGALTLERGMGMWHGHDPLFSDQSPLPSLPIYRHCTTLVPLVFNF